jgi:hypothetical protein
VRPDGGRPVHRDPARDAGRQGAVVAAIERRVDGGVHGSGAVGKARDLLRHCTRRPWWSHGEFGSGIEHQGATSGRPDSFENPRRPDPGVNGPDSSRFVRPERANVIARGENVRVVEEEGVGVVEQPLDPRLPGDDRLGDEERMPRPETLIAGNREGVQRLDPKGLCLLEDRPWTGGCLLDQNLSEPRGARILPLARCRKEASRVGHECFGLGVVCHWGIGVGCRCAATANDAPGPWVGAGAADPASGAPTSSSIATPKAEATARP